MKELQNFIFVSYRHFNLARFKNSQVLMFHPFSLFIYKYQPQSCVPDLVHCSELSLSGSHFLQATCSLLRSRPYCSHPSPTNVC